MSKKQKLIKRLLSVPNDFTIEELTRLLGHFGYRIVASGKTGGSRIVFSHRDGHYLRLHRPHPGNVLKPYQVRDVIDTLKARGLL